MKVHTYWQNFTYIPEASFVFPSPLTMHRKILCKHWPTPWQSIFIVNKKAGNAAILMACGHAGVGCITWQNLGVSLHPTPFTLHPRNMEQKSWRWPFFFFQNSFIFHFCFGLKVPTDFPRFSKILYYKKDNYLFFENHDVCKDKLKYQNISFERAYEKAEL